MALETGTYISDLVVTNPTSSDPKSQGDDHLRLLKATIKTTFPGVTGAVTPTHTELNYVDGVTSAIQTQFSLKAPLDSPTFTGVPVVPTADTGTSGGQAASLDYVIATALSGVLPGQVGNAGKFLTTDGTNGSWGGTIDPSVMTLTGGITIVGESGAQSLEDKTLVDPFIADDGDPTKKIDFDLSDITTATTRTITLKDEAVKLFTGYQEYLGKVTASASATVDVEGFFTSEFDNYTIECDNLRQTSGADRALRCRFKKSGVYLAASYSNQEMDGDVNTGLTYIPMFSYDTGTTQSAMFRANLTRVNDVGAHGVEFETIKSTNFNALDSVKGANTDVSSALEGVRFFLDTGNIASGDFKVYGIRKS